MQPRNTLISDSFIRLLTITSWAYNNIKHILPEHFLFSPWSCKIWAHIICVHWEDTSVQFDEFSSVAQSCPTLCNPMNCSTSGLPVHHQLLESTQTHVHRVSMPSNHLTLCCPLLLLPSIFPSIRFFSNESALRIRFQSIGVSASTSVLPINTQDWPPLGWTGWISLQSKGLSRVFSKTTVQKHQFFGAQLSS